MATNERLIARVLAEPVVRAVGNGGGGQRWDAGLRRGWRRESGRLQLFLLPGAHVVGELEPGEPERLEEGDDLLLVLHPPVGVLVEADDHQILAEGGHMEVLDLDAGLVGQIRDHVGAERGRRVRHRLGGPRQGCGPRLRRRAGPMAQLRATFHRRVSL